VDQVGSSLITDRLERGIEKGGVPVTTIQRKEGHIRIERPLPQSKYLWKFTEKKEGTIRS